MSDQKSETAGIVLNIGTPDSPEVKDVGRYLIEFLSDKEVVNIPFFVRIPLVRFVIVPRRVHFSSEKYKKVCD